MENLDELKRIFMNKWHIAADKNVVCGFVPYRSKSLTLETPSGKPFEEILAPGCFGDPGNIRVLMEHDPARLVSKSLHFYPEERGLVFKFFVDSRSDLMERIKAGELQISPGFKTLRDSWKPGRDINIPVRTILEAELLELSLCEHPAYTSSSACTLAEQRRIEALQTRTIQVIEGVGWVSKDAVETSFILLGGK